MVGQPRKILWWFVICFFSALGAVTAKLWLLVPNKEVSSPAINVKPTGTVAGAMISLVPVSSMTPTLTAVPTPSPELSVTTQPTSTPIEISVTPTSITTSVFGLQNSAFNQGLEAWQSQGEVKVLPVSQEARGVLPAEFKYFVRLSSATNFDWLGAHQLTQQFQIPQDATSLEFWYRIWTEETELGFDSPCLVGLINQQPIVWFSAAESRSVGEAPIWKHLIVPLPAQATAPVTLSFMAGQTGDQSGATWVDLVGLSLSQSATSIDHYRSDNPLKLSISSRLGISHLADPDEVLPDFSGLLDSLNKPQFGDSASLFLPEIGAEFLLKKPDWQPTGNAFQPEILAPEFWPLTSVFYQPEVSLSAVKEKLQNHPTTPIYLLLKSLQNQIQQLLPVDFTPG